jgi:hypothetical protein
MNSYLVDRMAIGCGEAPIVRFAGIICMTGLRAIASGGHFRSTGMVSG